MTDNERMLLLLVTDAILLMAGGGDHDESSIAHRIRHARRALENEAWVAYTARQTAVQTEAQRRAQGDAWIARQRADFNAAGIPLGDTMATTPTGDVR